MSISICKLMSPSSMNLVDLDTLLYIFSEWALKKISESANVIVKSEYNTENTN